MKEGYFLYLLLTVGLARFLRLLAATGLCEEVGVQTYAANLRTAFYSQPGTVAGVKFQ